MTADYKILLDVPLTTHLELGFNQLADAFKDIIERSDPQFAIGLFGGWGSGKTTLMEAIDSRLNKQTCAIVWFCAWRYQKEEHLIVPLLDVVREGIVGWLDNNQTAPDSVKQTAKRVGATIGKGLVILLTGFSFKAGVPGAMEIAYDASKAIARADKFDEADVAARVSRSFYHASFSALREAFADFTGAMHERRIVVFVDDLDRCLPDSALEVLESMKLFFDLPGFVFVVGLDRPVVEVCVEKRYREILSIGQAANGSPKADVISGANYLRKIFQVPFTLAPVSSEQIDEFLRSIQNTADLPTAQWQEIDSHVRPHLRFLADASGMNPREIKRYINSYTLVRKVKPNLNKDIVLALQTMAFRSDWQPVQIALLTFREAFIDALRRHVIAPTEGHLEGLSPDLATISQSFATYVGPGQPGNVLVANLHYNVGEYIYSGEATRSSVSTIFLDLFRDIGLLAPMIRRVCRQDLAPPEIISKAQEALGRLRTTDQAPRATSVATEIEALIERFETSDVLGLRNTASGPVSETSTSASRDRLSAARDRLREVEQDSLSNVRQAIKHLRELYQAGTL